ncbi:MAG: phytanoyl-CoA dioxygenase family protein [Fimbriimonadaceae bacterium]|nr:phytanoyl-CoA dioxygenase family protein [Fimbriimonadaceae bacterium]
MLTADQVAFYHEQGYLHLPEVYSPAEMDALDRDLSWLIESWAVENMGWTGPWRQVLMDAATEQQSKLVHLHDLQFYAQSWLHAVTHPRLVAALTQLLGENVELHHSTLHAKPPETGHPFPLHQDSPFYQHRDERYVDVLVHLDDTAHANGEIRFLAGSHRAGHLEHVTQTPDGPCTPHLPTDRYRLADTTPVPARRGDVVFFNIYTVHGSYVNTTDRVRRMVRVGYRDPLNEQIGGQSLGRPGLLVAGRRPRGAAAAPFSTEAR